MKGVCTMTDFKLTDDWDIAIDEQGEISTTESIRQAVLVRLKWFLDEWRLGPTLGFPYFEEVFQKNPNVSKIKQYIRETVIAVEGVTKITKVEIAVDKQKRTAVFYVTFATAYETYTQEVMLNG